MSKFIIDNTTDVSDYEVLSWVRDVILNGRISNYGKQYCYLTGVKHDSEYYYIITYLNKKSDRFVIYKESTNVDM